MRKVTIKRAPQMRTGGTTYPNIFMQTAPWSVHNTAGEPATEVRGTVERDDKNPNIEAEGGETILDPNVNGLPAHFNINGPSHAEGGVPMRATEDSFIFSKFLKMPKDLAEYFGFANKKGKSKTSKYSFADAAKKHGSVINKAREVMADPRSTKTDIDTAELNIKNAIDKLGQISLAQEASKGYEDGVPALAMPYLMRVGADPNALFPMAGNEQMEQAPDDEMAEAPMAMFGGAKRRLKRAQTIGSLGKAAMEGARMNEAANYSDDVKAKEDAAANYVYEQMINNDPTDGYDEFFYDAYNSSNRQRANDLSTMGDDPSIRNWSYGSQKYDPGSYANWINGKLGRDVVTPLQKPWEGPSNVLGRINNWKDIPDTMDFSEPNIAPNINYKTLEPAEPRDYNSEEIVTQQGGELPKAQRGRNRRMQKRINNLRRAQIQPRIITDRNTGMTYVVDGYGNIINTPFAQNTPATSRTTVTKFKPAEGATIITRNENESDVDFQKRLREEFNKASNKQQVYTIKADGGYQRVTKTTVSKKLPKADVTDPRLGGFIDDYAHVEGVLKDPANKGIVDRMYEEYKRQIDASNLSAARKAELKKKSPEEVLDNFLKAQKQVFAITKAEVEGKVDPITKNKAWDKGGSNKNNIYRKTAKDIGFKDDEIFNDDQIAMFQAAYKGIQAAADDPQYKSTLENFTLVPRGMADQKDAAGRAISPVDDIFGNTTAGQGLFVKGLKEEGIGFEDMEDKTTTEQQPGSPTYTKGDHELEYLGPDVTNMAANLMIGANQPNVMPASFPMAPVNFNQVFLDPSREVAETQGTAQGALRAAGIYGSPQSYASAAASTQAQAANQIANTLGKYFNANNEIANSGERARADLAFKTNAYNLENGKRYYDEITQKVQNDKQQQNEFIAQTAALKNAMDVNAAGVYNIEEMAGDRFRIDKPTMTTYFNKGKKLTGQEKFDEYEAQLARMNDLMKRGVSADKAAQVIFGGKGMNPQDPGDSEADMFNEMIQRYNMGDPQAAAMLQQYAQAAGTGAQGYMFGGLI